MSTVQNKRRPCAYTASAVSKQDAYSPSRTAGLRPFAPGQSGNPAGRKKGSRNKLGEAFVTDFLEVWQEKGKAAIEKLATEDVATFVRVAASILPKEVGLERRSLEEMSDEELGEAIQRLRALVAMHESETEH